jgi:PAS domain S-box-containing protein
MYGYGPEEVLGKNISILTSKDRPDEITSILARIQRGEHITHYESIRVTKDGRRLNVSISISPIRDAGGVIVGASAIARDVTEQKRAEEHLRQVQKMEAVGRLAGGLAHDFTTSSASSRRVRNCSTVASKLQKSRRPTSPTFARLSNAALPSPANSSPSRASRP